MSNEKFIKPIGMIAMVNTGLINQLNDETKARDFCQDNDDEPSYTVAVETELFLGDDKNSLKGRYKALTNKSNENQIFSIVGDGYQVIQHDEVVNTINDALEDLNMVPTSRIEELNDGGRIHGEMVFKDHYVDVTGMGDVINLRVSFDNSYDCSTGVRMNFGAFHPTRKVLLYIGERYSKYYHKHTKGLNKVEIATGISKGGEIFQDKIGAMFKGMATTTINFAHVKSLLEEKVDKKSSDIPAKYLNAVCDKVNSGTRTMWDLFLTFSEVLSDDCDSIDARGRHALKFLAMFNKAVNENRIQ